MDMVHVLNRKKLSLVPLVSLLAAGRAGRFLLLGFHYTWPV
jgi:hypothetical protein